MSKFVFQRLKKYINQRCYLVSVVSDDQFVSQGHDFIGNPTVHLMNIWTYSANDSNNIMGDELLIDFGAWSQR